MPKRIARENTNKRAEIQINPNDTEDDFVTSRILWLDGLENGINRGVGVDSFSRYIYIHGTHEEGLIDATKTVQIGIRGAQNISEGWDYSKMLACG